MITSRFQTCLEEFQTQANGDKVNLENAAGNGEINESAVGAEKGSIGLNNAGKRNEERRLQAMEEEIKKRYLLHEDTIRTVIAAMDILQEWRWRGEV